ncbi:uncharacterized protein LOC144361485 [Saccoglossus kowalevskii]
MGSWTLTSNCNFDDFECDIGDAVVSWNEDEPYTHWGVITNCDSTGWDMVIHLMPNANPMNTTFGEVEGVAEDFASRQRILTAARPIAGAVVRKKEKKKGEKKCLC